jgi:hypothetical protein
MHVLTQLFAGLKHKLTLDERKAINNSVWARQRVAIGRNKHLLRCRAGRNYNIQILTITLSPLSGVSQV